MKIIKVKEDYQYYRNKLLKLKEEIEIEYREKRSISNVDEKINQLDSLLNDIMKLEVSENDKFFIKYNYHSAKTLLCIEKRFKFQVYLEFLNAFKYFIMFYETNKNIKFARKGLKYYEIQKENILKNINLDIFGDKKEKILHIIKSWEEIIKIITKLDGDRSFITEAVEIIMDLFRRIILRSSEIYDQEDIELKQYIYDLLVNYVKDEFFEDQYNLVLVYKYIALFNLTKRELFFKLRRLVPKDNKKNFLEFTELEHTIGELQRYANKERKVFKLDCKTLYNKNEKECEYLKFLIKLDKEITLYYKLLFLKKDFLKAIKQIGKIFDLIRENSHIILSERLTTYFLQEYIFLKTFLKLLILSNELTQITNNSILMEWQKELFIDIKKHIDNILRTYFKYGFREINKELLIVDVGIDGILIEFIIFYLLREFVIQRVDFDKEIKKFRRRNENFARLLEILKNVPDLNYIKWGKEINNSDIDIFIRMNRENVAIFIKTGNIKSKLDKVYNEIENAKRLKCRYIFQILDFSKNTLFINKLLKRKLKDEDIIFLDVKEVLDFLLEIAKSYDNIDIRLKKDSIYTYAGLIFK